MPLSSPTQPHQRAHFGWLADSLRSAGLRSGRPGTLWLAGFAYHFLSFGWTFGLILALPFLGSMGFSFGEQVALQWGSNGLLLTVSSNSGLGIVLLAPIALAMARAASGMARLAPKDRWDHAYPTQQGPRLRHAWREGKGGAFAATLLWLQVWLMMGLLASILILPLWTVLASFNLHHWSNITAAFMGAAVAITMVYGFLLSILFQLALHSLVRNRRGVGSALLHAWRLVRNDPQAAIRATAMDAVLQLVSNALSSAVYFLNANLHPVHLVTILAYTMISGCLGCVRCLYWSQVYEELGGLTTAPLRGPKKSKAA